MPDLGLRARVILILLVAVLAIGAAAVAVGFGERRVAEPLHVPYPRIEQAAGVLDLLRTVAPGQWPMVLRAVSGPYLNARLIEHEPAAVDRLRRAPKIEGMLRDDAAPGLDDGLRAYTDVTIPFKTFGTEGFPARIVWPTPDGRILVLDTRAFPVVPPPTLLGLTSGVWIGLIGVGVAGLALSVMARELRPLRHLTAAAANFDGRSLAEITERGAPDIRRLIRAVSGMQHRLAALLQERSFLIGAISHDLKTYLTRLRLRIEGLADPDQRARAAADLDAMTDLIDTSLAFARGTAVTDPDGIVDLADLVAIEAAERAAEGQPVSASGDDVDDAFVQGDPVALRRVLANLVDNAVKFGHGRVEIALERGHEGWQIKVDDDGPGVSETQRTAIFRPFYRIEGSRGRGTGGSGLGLAIARQIVEACGGSLDISTSPLGGARFIVDLPRGRRRRLPRAAERGEASRIDGCGADPLSRNVSAKR